MGGPTGKWINMRTGNTIIVKDTFTEGDRMTVMCSDGRMIPMSEFSRDYVQMDESMTGQQTVQQPAQSRPAFDESLLLKGMGPRLSEETAKMAQPQQPRPIVDMPMQDNSYIGEHNDPYVSGHNDLYGGRWDNGNYVMDDVESTKTNSLVTRLLDKCKTPKITIGLSWDDAPINELNMLKTIYDVTDDEIVNAVVDKFISLEAIKEQMSKKVNDLLSPSKPVEKKVVPEKKTQKNKES